MIKIAIYDARNELIFHDSILKLNFPEVLIIKKSREWFRDPTPCFLHKSAVIKRILIELEDYILNQNRRIYYEEIPEKVREILSCYSDVQYVES